MLHAHAPRPVVMFSGDGDDALIHAAVGAGVTAYVVDGLAPARLRPSCRWRWPVLRRKAAGAAGPQADRPREGLADGKTWPERGRCLCGITPAGDEAGRQTDRSGAPYRGHGRIQPGLGRAACRLRTRARCHVDGSPGRRVASAGRRGCAGVPRPAPRADAPRRAGACTTGIAISTACCSRPRNPATPIDRCLPPHWLASRGVVRGCRSSRIPTAHLATRSCAPACMSRPRRCTTPSTTAPRCTTQTTWRMPFDTAGVHLPADASLRVAGPARGARERGRCAAVRPRWRRDRLPASCRCRCAGDRRRECGIRCGGRTGRLADPSQPLPRHHLRHRAHARPRRAELGRACGQRHDAGYLHGPAPRRCAGRCIAGAFAGQHTRRHRAGRHAAGAATSPHRPGATSGRQPPRCHRVCRPCCWWAMLCPKLLQRATTAMGRWRCRQWGGDSTPPMTRLQGRATRAHGFRVTWCVRIPKTPCRASGPAASARGRHACVMVTA